MTKKQITHLQDMIDDFISKACYDCTIESEGYRHTPYISSLGVSTHELIYLIDEINEHLGNQIELTETLLDKPSFKQCMHNLSHNIPEPEVMLHLIQTKDVVDSSNNKLIYSVWRHDSGRLIQLLQQEFFSMNEDKSYMKTLSCNEVVERFNNLTRETDYVLKEQF